MENTREKLIELSNKPFSFSAMRDFEEAFTPEQKEEIKKIGLSAFIEKEQFNKIFGKFL